MDYDKDVMFIMDLFVEKDGGEKVPFVVSFYRASKKNNGPYEGVVTTTVNGVVKREKKVAGLDTFGAVLYGIRLVFIEMDYLFLKKGYQLYRKVALEGGGEEYCEVGVEDVFPYAKR